MHWIFTCREPTAPSALFVLPFFVPAINPPLLARHYGNIFGVVYTFLAYRTTLANSILYPILPFDPQSPQVWLPLIEIRDNACYAHHRKLWTRAFSSAALKNYELIIAKRVSISVRRVAGGEETGRLHALSAPRPTTM